MKIILSAKCVYPFHPVGGVQKYVYYFAKHLAQKGIDLEIVAPLDKGKPRTESYDGLKYTFLKPAIHHYLEYPIGWLGVHLFSRSLSRYLKGKPFDLLHSFDLTGYGYVKNRNRRPVIVHIFSDNYLSNPISFVNPLHLFNLTASRFDRIREQKIALSPFAGKATKLKYLLQYFFKVRPMHQCLKRAEAVFYEADVFEKEVNALYRLDPQKGAVVPVGIDLPFIRQALEKTKTSREELGLKHDDIVLITVNRLAADKGVDNIVLSLEKIIKEVPRVKLVIIGAGYQEEEILKVIEQKGLAGHVRHLKNVPEDELYAYYRLSDIYISAFSYPGSSISTLEAMACSLPVITTAQPWLVREGRNGAVLPDNRPGSIKDAVIGMIREKNLKMQGACSREIAEDYDWKNVAEKAVKRYEQILFKKVIGR